MFRFMLTKKYRFCSHVPLFGGWGGMGGGRWGGGETLVVSRCNQWIFTHQIYWVGHYHHFCFQVIARKRKSSDTPW
jgi:hypothetical protein